MIENWVSNIDSWKKTGLARKRFCFLGRKVSVSSDELVAVDDDNVYKPPNMAEKDILQFVRNSKNIIHVESDDESEMNNAAPYPHVIQNEEHHEKLCVAI
ncbi:hypothetical protein TNCV_4479951 [Trichonephila clavipes]|nr:hypothetical protein TNCV_4479951 [Trichonephila clavipes]